MGGNVLLSIPINDYFSYSLTFKSEEVKLCDNRMAWVPDQIIDCHAHCNLPEHVIGIDDKLRHHMMTTFPSFSLEQSAKARGVFFPNKLVKTLRFPNAFRGIDHKRANQYLIEHSDPRDRVALYGIPT